MTFAAMLSPHELLDAVAGTLRGEVGPGGRGPVRQDPGVHGLGRPRPSWPASCATPRPTPERRRRAPSGRRRAAAGGSAPGRARPARPRAVDALRARRRTTRPGAASSRPSTPTATARDRALRRARSARARRCGPGSTAPWRTRRDATGRRPIEDAHPRLPRRPARRRRRRAARRAAHRRRLVPRDVAVRRHVDAPAVSTTSEGFCLRRDPGNALLREMSDLGDAVRRAAGPRRHGRARRRRPYFFEADAGRARRAVPRDGEGRRRVPEPVGPRGPALLRARPPRAACCRTASPTRSSPSTPSTGGRPASTCSACPARARTSPAGRSPSGGR